MKLKQSYYKTGLAAVLAAGMCMLPSCSDKKKVARDIIATKPVVAKKKSTQKVGDYSQKRDVEWLGARYTVVMERKADTSLPLVADEQGNRYFDNSMRIEVRRADGTLFFARTFVKADFAKCLSASYERNGALLGVVFNEAKADCLLFAASVGSPDMMSDDFVPIVVKVSRTGQVSVYEDTQLDTSAGEETGEDEDV